MAAQTGARRPAATTMLDLIRAGGRLSRVELAALSGHTPPSVTKVIRALVEEGLVREAGLEHQSRGTPRRLLELVPDAWYAVGVQVDRTSSTVVVIDFAGRQVAGAGLRGSGDDAPQTTVEGLVDHVADLLTSVGVPRERVLGVGLVTHGPQDRERGMLLTSQPTPAWLGFPLTRTLGDGLGLPTLLENDATAAAIGEQWAGAVPIDTFGVLYMATGVGGAVVVDSEPYRGRASNAVEIGHLSLDRGGRRCVCGLSGCVQVEASPVAVVEAAIGRAGVAARLGLRGGSEETLADFERIARAARDGDGAARELLEHSAACLGAAAVTLANLFDLSTFVLAGPAFSTAGPLYRDTVEATLRAEALSRDLVAAEVIISSNVSTAAALGGALHVLRTMPPRRVQHAPLTGEARTLPTTTGAP
ncbi:ROK family transcriptional regulator [Cellulomonas sp. KH9]|uniref:ROK family transcriptional regulator n=1 Tax=Cellulomonas sp. KH9 TaxID=1855324 RepID=UPI0008F45A44|nr:ROK family transcriptional regulator [Cellulomonas sp. KH9]SFJ68884.1 Sugar kinase of the NBD/HSP70 family, may contain an N-terminal HTH domain [Cellulomonas sp. KH9]